MGCCGWPSLIPGRIQKPRAPIAKTSMLQEGSGHCSHWAVGNRAFPEARVEQGGEQVGPPDTSFQAGNKTGVSWKGQVLGRAPSLLEEDAGQALGGWLWGRHRHLPSPSSGVWSPGFDKIP